MIIGRTFVEGQALPDISRLIRAGLVPYSEWTIRGILTTGAISYNNSQSPHNLAGMRMQASGSM